MFLRNNFAGNARENLLKTLVTHKILTDIEVQECLGDYSEFFLSLLVSNTSRWPVEVQSTRSTAQVER